VKEGFPAHNLQKTSSEPIKRLLLLDFAKSSVS
jgi:hypothetical protein